MSACHCGSDKKFEICCQPFIQGTAKPPTAEALMRSRYTAFVLKDIGYIKKTTAPEQRKGFDEAGTRKWAETADWKGLQILKTEKGSEADKKGVVEFQVTYGENGKTLEHHEVSEFRKDDSGTWFFVDGNAHTHEEGKGHHHHHEKPQTVVREGPKVRRNDPCICGSGKKYKKCCGAEAG